jgi:hypothetical protein
VAWLTLNGIKVSGIAEVNAASGERRDIGSQLVAGDGSMVVTRIARKRDLKLKTIPLTGADAHAWEGLMVGESNVWSFDSSFYSSKGKPGTGSATPPTVQVQTGTKQYGAGALDIGAGEDWSTSGLGLGSTWTVAFWAKPVATAWVHYVIRSDGAKWVDGVRNDAFSASGVLVDVVSGEVILTNQAPVSARYFDDLVASPFLWLTEWPAQVFVAGQPFGAAPYLTAVGDMVREATTRKMVCKGLSEKVMVANIAGVRQRDARVLELELSGA